MKLIVAFAAASLTLIAHSSQAAEKVAFDCKTKKHHAKVLDLGGGRFEYKSWNVPKPESAKPDMQITQKDAASTQGTGQCAAKYFTFKKGDTEFMVNELGCSDGSEPKNAIGELVVSVKGDEKSRAFCLK